MEFHLPGITEWQTQTFGIYCAYYLECTIWVSLCVSVWVDGCRWVEVEGGKGLDILTYILSTWDKKKVENQWFRVVQTDHNGVSRRQGQANLTVLWKSEAWDPVQEFCVNVSFSLNSTTPVPFTWWSSLSLFLVLTSWQRSHRFMISDTPLRLSSYPARRLCIKIVTVSTGSSRCLISLRRDISKPGVSFRVQIIASSSRVFFPYICYLCHWKHSQIVY